MSDYNILIDAEKVKKFGLKEYNCGLITSRSEDYKKKLITEQKKILDILEHHDNVIIRKDRAIGITTLLSMFVSDKMHTETNTNFYYITCNYSQSCIVCNIIKDYNNLYTSKGSQTYERCLKFDNGNKIYLINKSSDFICAKDPNKQNWFIIDEMSYTENSKELYNYITSNFIFDKLIISSTPKSIDDIFCYLYFLGQKAGFTKIDISVDGDRTGNKETNEIIKSEGLFKLINKNLSINKFISEIQDYQLHGKEIRLIDLYNFFKKVKIDEPNNK